MISNLQNFHKYKYFSRYIYVKRCKFKIVVMLTYELTLTKKSIYVASNDLRDA